MMAASASKGLFLDLGASDRLLFYTNHGIPTAASGSKTDPGGRLSHRFPHRLGRQ
jgi:hypothetical protein